MKSKWAYVITVVFILIFLITRLVNIRSFPLFVDEGRHIVGAQLTISGDIFNGLKFGLKQLYIWILAIALMLFNDLVLTARVVSVLFGLVNGGICYKLAATLYPNRPLGYIPLGYIPLGYIAALFYLISPFALFYDRLALTDTLLATLVGINILLSLQLWRNPSTKWALALGLVFGLIALTKAYALFYLITPILFWLFWGRKISWAQIVKLMSIVFMIPLLTLTLMFTIGRGAYQAEYAEKFSPAVVIASFSEGSFFGLYWANVLLGVEWLTAYLTLPFVGLLIFAIILIVVKRDRTGFILITLTLFPLLIFPLIFTVWYSRYLLPLILSISVMIAWGIDHLAGLILSLSGKITPGLKSSLSHPFLQGMLFSILCIPSLVFSYWIITDPIQASLPVTDKWDYIEGRFSGYGLAESAEIVDQIAAQYPQVIILQGTNWMDTISSVDVTGMRLYLSNPEKVSVEMLGELDANIGQRLNAFAKEAPTLTLRTYDINDDPDLAVSKIFEHPQAWPLASFPKPGQQIKVDLYQWLLPADFAIRWLQQGGNADPRVAGAFSDTLVTTTGGVFFDWPEDTLSTPEAMQQWLTEANVEYVLASPELINRQPDLFAPFMTTDGTRLQLTRLPPGWRLAFVYPDLNCNWCLFQLKPPDYPTQVMFGETVRLAGYDISATQLSPDDTLNITLSWESSGALPKSYVVFVHLLDANGQLVGQVDQLPLQGQWPTHNWRAGDRLADRYTLNLEPALPAGDYQVVVGLYDPEGLERLPAYAKQNQVLDNGVVLTTVSVK
jgi:hypothetical protein